MWWYKDKVIMGCDGDTNGLVLLMGVKNKVIF